MLDRNTLKSINFKYKFPKKELNLNFYEIQIYAL